MISKTEGRDHWVGTEERETGHDTAVDGVTVPRFPETLLVKVVLGSLTVIQ